MDKQKTTTNTQHTASTIRWYLGYLKKKMWKAEKVPSDCEQKEVQDVCLFFPQPHTLHETLEVHIESANTKQNPELVTQHSDSLSPLEAHPPPLPSHLFSQALTLFFLRSLPTVYKLTHPPTPTYRMVPSPVYKITHIHTHTHTHTHTHIPCWISPSSLEPVGSCTTRRRLGCNFSTSDYTHTCTHTCRMRSGKYVST